MWNSSGGLVTSAAKGSGNADNESEIIQSATIINFVNPHLGIEQTDNECDRGYESVPYTCPESRPASTGNLIFRTWTSDG